MSLRPKLPRYVPVYIGAFVAACMYVHAAISKNYCRYASALAADVGTHFKVVESILELACVTESITSDLETLHDLLLELPDARLLACVPQMPARWHAQTWQL